MSGRYGAEPGFITMNLPMLLDALEGLGIENPIVCSNINKIGFRMCGGIEAYRAGSRRTAVPGGRDVGVRLRCDPAREAIEWVCGQEKIDVDRLRRFQPRQHPLDPPAGRVPLGAVSTLLVASTGGHLKELHHLRDRVDGVGPPYSWVTFDTEQSRSLLAGEEVDFVPFVGGRDPRGVARNLACARRIFGRRRPDAVLSTGSAVALPYFALGRARGLPCHFVESAARIDGPSLTGRLMTGVPGVLRYSQYADWTGAGWHFRGSVFDSFAGAEDEVADPPRLERIVVSLGTYRGYDFSRLVRRLLAILPREAEVLWQTGDTDVSALGIEGHEAIPEAELTEAMSAADAIVAHAGVGTALAAFEVGKFPVLVPRRLSLGEHVDDHQVQIARELAARGLARSVDADDLCLGDLEAVAARRVLRPAQAPAFEIVS